MFRVIENKRFVLIGFDNKNQSDLYWNSLKLCRDPKCRQYSCYGDEEDIKQEMEYSLNDLDDFILGMNCLSFLKIPRGQYDRIKPLLEKSW